MDNKIQFLLIVLINILVVGVDCERPKDKMYTPIIGASCFRRLNGTHQIGCSSKFSGSTGVLHLINSTEALQFILDDPPAPPYALIIEPKFFTQYNILLLKNTAGKNISAIVLINILGDTEPFSHDLKCPNQFKSSESQNCDASQPDSVWNPFGTGLMYEDFPFPIYYVADGDEISKIMTCYERFNSFDVANQNTRSLCSIEINQFMAASVNSETCMRRTRNVQNLSPTKYCDPLQGKNIFATLFPRKTIEGQGSKRTVNLSEKFILVSCRLDTTSMFDGVGSGAMDSLVSFATLVSVGHTLVRLLPENKSNYAKNVLFAVFNGESFDFIGSQRLVYDMEHHAFPLENTKTNPISFEQIELMIDIGALDQLNNISFYSMTTKHTEMNDYINHIQAYTSKMNLNVTFNNLKITSNMPPTSAQSFLKKNITFPALVLNSHPENKYYHSIYDDAYNIRYKYMNSSLDFTKLIDQNTTLPGFQANSVQMKINNVATALALGLYSIITQSVYNGNAMANPVLIDEFLHCFLNSTDCPLFRAASYPGHFVSLPIPPQRYISVSLAYQTAPIFTFEIFGLLLSQPILNTTKDNCEDFSMYWYAGYDGNGECRRTTQQYSEALSPAFFEEDYDWKSGKYSTWTESTWQHLSARIYLRPSNMHDAITLSIGVFVLILSFVFVFLINSRSDVLFGHVLSTVVLEPAAC